MLPGFSPRELKRALKRMGLELEEVGNVVKVEIYLEDKKITIDKPQVVFIKSREQTIVQVVGSMREEKLEAAPKVAEVKISEDDVEFVASQAGVSREEARRALLESRGDIAEAILKLREKRGV
ncbi:MAG: nascent polypeptide-associated complex protein [Thermogladius sp.]|uniref:Nascent polypeptide-associated complex protein n=1 Tax=Thermogladius calderae TaxID=1200300 RepID=A0A7J3XY15_9CREN|nr:nascent polypeptide-associated complex protein [Thermogladius sp.]